MNGRADAGPGLACRPKVPRHFLAVGDKLNRSFHAHLPNMADEELNLYDEIEIEEFRPR